MISYDVIVAAIEQHARQATGDEATVREELSAIRALCDVVLGDAPKPMPQQVAPVVQQPVVPQMAQPMMQQASIPTKKIEEGDANGDSLFDF